MKEQQIKQALSPFTDFLTQGVSQPVSLSLRANLLHEAKKLNDTLEHIFNQQSADSRELFFKNALGHFIACVRLERADMLKASCQGMIEEVARVQKTNSVSGSMVKPASVLSANPV